MQGSSKVSPKKWMDRLFGQRRSDSLQEWNVEEEVKTDLYSPGWPDLRTIFLCLNLLMLFKSSLSRRGKDVKIWSVTLSCYHGRIPVGENYNLKDCSTRFNTGKNGFIGLEIEKRFQNRRTMVSNFQVWRKMKSAWSLTDVGRGVRKWEWGRSAGWGERQQWTEGSAVRVPCRPLIRMDPHVWWHNSIYLFKTVYKTDKIYSWFQKDSAPKHSVYIPASNNLPLGLYRYQQLFSLFDFKWYPFILGFGCLV